MKPIIVDTEPIKYILDKRLTTFWRILKVEPGYRNDIIYKDAGSDKWFISPDNDSFPETEVEVLCDIGDVLYVHEAWRATESECHHGYTIIQYKSGQYMGMPSDKLPTMEKCDDWRSPESMPENIARFFLYVTDMRIKRLHDISMTEYLENELLLSMVEASFNPHSPTSAQERLISIWNKPFDESSLPLYGWDANPWIQIVKFKEISKEEAFNYENTCRQNAN